MLLVIKLLIKTPEKRLGAKNDSEDLKKHDWFKDINWDDLVNLKVLII